MRRSTTRSPSPQNRGSGTATGTSWPPRPRAATCPTSSRWTRSTRSEEHTSELQSRFDLVCRLLLEKKKKNKTHEKTTRVYVSREKEGAQRRACSAVNRQ